MKRTSTALLLTLALATPAMAQDSISKVNGSVQANAGQTYGDLETVNGSINIEDNATTREASTVNGGISVGNGAKTAGLETVNGGIKAGAKVQVDGDVETVNGGIFFDRGSRIRDDISTVNGGIGLVGTDVGGGIETVSGDITVGVDSHVKGGIKVEKPKGNFNFHANKRPPRIVIGPNAVVEGPLVFEREVVLYVHASAKTGAITGATAKRFDTATAPQD
ncbi:hypothetical protein [Pseudoxanthomonas indica]|uniref:Polymer-forming protein n=1 Tax=Pseudoxanthomonas indica TaxID=428993 RepID=A0A1T5KTW4_9GAMM|nr:hypothetical protein [Pseudoxanthomonas indica]GGD51625.1 hypothetical protein GCM10007235_24820 [Pseudoxanthomonas indica]SKC67232.1 hypothetical protein SAMN06296058_2030 [Pseudoxanthomonas indica]